MSESSNTEGLVLGYQHMHAFAPEDFRKVYGQVTHAILRGESQMSAKDRVRDMVSRVWIPANLALRDDKDVAGIGVRMLLAWSQELALIVARMEADEQRLRRDVAQLYVFIKERHPCTCSGMHLCERCALFIDTDLPLRGDDSTPPPASTAPPADR